MGAQREPPAAGRAAGVRRAPRRPRRAAPGVHRRCAHLRHRLGGRGPGARLRGAAGRPGGPGSRRRADAPEHRGHRQLGLPPRQALGGALGIAVLYSVFHTTYVDQLTERVDASSLPKLTARSGTAVRDTLQSAEASGLKPSSLDRELLDYIVVAGEASNYGYRVTFIAVAVIAAVAGGLVAWLVRKPAPRPSLPGVSAARPLRAPLAPSPAAWHGRCASAASAAPAWRARSS